MCSCPTTTLVCVCSHFRCSVAELVFRTNATFLFMFLTMYNDAELFVVCKLIIYAVKLIFTIIRPCRLSKHAKNVVFGARGLLL